MKQPKAVVDALARVDAKANELAEVLRRVDQLKVELSDARNAVRTAQVEADAALPQCCMVVISHYGTRASQQENRVVILRKTPTGTLVVRHVGDYSGSDMKFKFVQHTGRFRQLEKASFSSTYRELRDVPQQYMPNT